MALYGGNVGSYTTPDGRVVQMPSGLAGMFPSLQPQVSASAPPPPGQQVAAGPGTPPPELGAPALPPAGLPAGPPPGAPEPMTGLPLGTNPTWNPQDSADLAKQTQQAKAAQDTAELQDLAKKQKTNPGLKRAAAVTSQDGGQPGTQTDANGVVTAKPLTNTDLQKMGVGGPATAALAAEEQKKQAIEGKGGTEADQATQVAAAMKANEAADQKRLADMQAEADRRQAQLDQHNNDLMAQAKKIADTKIDRTADHPILTAIGVALATLGTAMQNRDAALAAAFRGQPAPAPIENPGLKAMYAAIDRKVAAQMADLDNQKAAYGLQSQAVTNERGIMKDRLDQMAAMRVGYLDHAKQEIARIEKETSVPIIKQNTALAAADVDREKAATLADAQNRFTTQQNAEAARKQELSIAQMHNATALRGQNLQYTEHAETIAAQKEERAAQLAERLIEKGDAAAAARMKLVGEQGIVDPFTGDFMLTPAGQQKMQQADRLEAQARAATDPAQAAALNQQAQQYRDSARTNDAAMALNKKGAEDAQRTAKVAQDMTNNVDAARRMLQGDPGAWNRDQWAQIKVALQGVKVNYAQQMGERMSPKALDAIDDVLSINDDSIVSRTVDKGKATAALDTIEKQINQSADVALKSAGVKSGWTPGKATNAPALSGKTADELAADAEPGLISRSVGNPIRADIDAIAHPDQASWDRWNKISSGEAQKEQARDVASSRTNAAGQSNSYGLDPKDHSVVLSEIKRAGAAGHADYDRIVSNLAAPLTDEKRPSLARGVAQLVNDEDPKLFDAVLAKVASSAGGGEIAAKRLRELVAPTPGVRRAIPAPASLGSMTPEALKAYNEMLRKQGLPEVRQ